jgi:hypothetical protein
MTMHRPRVAVLALILGLVGCAGVDYTVQHYSTVDLNEVEMPDDTYRIFDKPTEGRMMVQSSIGSALVQGIAAGITFGAAPESPPKPFFQAAAERYLEQTGRKCKIMDGYFIVTPAWEFRYSCEQ